MQRVIFVTTQGNPSPKGSRKIQTQSFNALASRIAEIASGQSVCVFVELGGGDALESSRLILSGALGVDTVRHDMVYAVNTIGPTVRDIAEDYDTLVLLFRDPVHSSLIFADIFSTHSSVEMKHRGTAIQIMVTSGFGRLIPGQICTI